MYLNTTILEECCGCSSCVSICPHASIATCAANGFDYPVIHSNCIDCGLCRQVCDFSCEEDDVLNSPIIAYGMHHLDDKIRMISRSGGAFYMLASHFIEHGGVVWGAAIDDSLKTNHICVNTIEQLHLLQGSKYVQSDLGCSFQKIGKQLQNKENVLFSGTACQVAGLKRYLKTRKICTDSLLTCDIICQGVPSPHLFKDYLAYLEKKYKKHIIKFDFRDKARMGWSSHEVSALFQDGKKIFRRDYVNLFYSSLSIRPSCFKCKYTSINRPADITLGDFWCKSNNREALDFVDEIGNSLIIINTDKGIHFLDKTKHNGSFIPLKPEDYLQPRLLSPTQRPKGYSIFWDEYNRFGLEYVAKKYGKGTIKSRLVYSIKPTLIKLYRLLSSF